MKLIFKLMFVLSILNSCAGRNLYEQIETEMIAKGIRFEAGSKILIIFYKVTECINCDIRIRQEIAQYQKDYSISESNTIFLIDYIRDSEIIPIQSIVDQVYGKRATIFKLSLFKNYLNLKELNSIEAKSNAKIIVLNKESKIDR